MNRSVRLTLAALAVICLPALAFAAQGDVVSIDAGSYIVQAGGNAPFQTANVKGSPPTTSWFTSLMFKGKDSFPQYAHPLGLRPTGDGLVVHNPGAYMHADKVGAFAFTLPPYDLVLTSSDGGKFSDVLLDAYSDWFITTAFLNSGKGMRCSYGHGSPFVYVTFDSGSAVLTAGRQPVKVWHGGKAVAGEPGRVLGVTIGNSHYGFFGPVGSSWAVDGNKFTNVGAEGKNYFSLAVLPDNKPETLDLFKKYAYNHVTDTRTAWTFDRPAGAMKVTYSFVTKAMEPGGADGTLTALYPHQWKYADAKLTQFTGQSYACLNGAMKLASGPSFTTSVPIQGVLPMLPPEGVGDKERLKKYLVQDMPDAEGYKDTYWEGKFLGKLATMSEIAELVGDKAIHDECQTELKRRFAEWFTAKPGKGAQVFKYNPTWGALVGYPASYGSDTWFNDHHFHYGYFIRAAAEVARCDPAWAKEWGGMVNLLIRDFASPDRQDKMFPYMRCFDRYAGHSWASGDAAFAEGNNQESSSESMNAWYGILLWGTVTGNKEMADLGLFLYTTEMTAVEEYWFDVSGTNFPKEYPHACVGMVWGGKIGWITWFGMNGDYIHGINWLPFTPGSMYLMRYPDYIKKAYASVLEFRTDKDDLTKGWGDLVLMWRAGADPADAAKFADANLDRMGIEAGNSHAFLYHWVHTLDSLGQIDRTVSADYPIFNVYAKGGKKTYVVYNMGDKPLTVKFTDGTKLDCKAKGFASVTK